MKKFLALFISIYVLFSTAVAANADLPTQDTTSSPSGGQRFAAARLRIAIRVDNRHDEWLHQKEIRRDKIHARRVAAVAAVAAAEAAAALTVPPATSAPPSYVTSSSGGALSEAQVASYLRAAGFPEDVIPTMIQIAHHESGLCPSAVYGYGCNVGGTTHGTLACGLFQIYHCPGPEALDPSVNANLAYAKYEDGGLSPWNGAF